MCINMQCYYLKLFAIIVYILCRTNVKSAPCFFYHLVILVMDLILKLLPGYNLCPVQDLGTTLLLV